jgi:hypothetical protein
MTDRIQVQCINKSDRSNYYERIKYIGGLNGDGTRWKLIEEEAIQGIETGKWSFFVSVNGISVDVIIAVGESGRKYLKTTSDGYHPNNLLSLPECP